jgi:hypothetical protein
MASLSQGALYANSGETSDSARNSPFPGGLRKESLPQLRTFNNSLESPIDRVIKFFYALRSFIDSRNLLAQ